MNDYFFTQNPIVEAVGKMNFTGNVIPESWYQTIVNENHKVNLLACMILAEIVYWYRPCEVRDETTSSISYAKKFADPEFLQLSYQRLSDKFNISKNQARDAIVFLEELGVIKRHFKSLSTPTGTIANVMFIELVPSVLEALTYPVLSTPICTLPDTYEESDREVSTFFQTPICEKAETNTKNTTKTTTQSFTQTLSPDTLPLGEKEMDRLKTIFEHFNFSDEQLCMFYRAAEGDFERIQKGKDALGKSCKPIKNVTAWMCTVIRNEKNNVPYSPSNSTNSFNNFEKTDYDFNKLEKLLVCN